MVKKYKELREKSRKHQKEIKSRREYEQERKYYNILYNEFWYHIRNENFSGFREPPFDILKNRWKPELIAKREAISSYCHKELIEDDWKKKEKVRVAWNELGSICRKKGDFLSLLEFEVSDDYTLKIIRNLQKNQSEKSEDIEIRHRDSIPRKVKNRVRDRDGDQCVNCSTSENLRYHHIRPVSDGGKDIVSNIVLVCNVCHKELHNNRQIYRNNSLVRGKENFWRWAYGQKTKIDNKSFKKQTTITLHSLISSELEYIKNRFDVPKELEDFIESEQEEFSDLDSKTKKKYEEWADKILGIR